MVSQLYFYRNDRKPTTINYVITDRLLELWRTAVSTVPAAQSQCESGLAFCRGSLPISHSESVLCTAVDSFCWLNVCWVCWPRVCELAGGIVLGEVLCGGMSWKEPHWPHFSLWHMLNFIKLWRESLVLVHGLTLKCLVCRQTSYRFLRDAFCSAWCDFVRRSASPWHSGCLGSWRSPKPKYGERCEQNPFKCHLRETLEKCGSCASNSIQKLSKESSEPHTITSLQSMMDQQVIDSIDSLIHFVMLSSCKTRWSSSPLPYGLLPGHAYETADIVRQLVPHL